MTGFKSTPLLYFVHQDQVMALPPEAELLGGNDFCPNTFYTIGEQVLGIQGHPEFPKTLMKSIIEGQLAKVGETLHNSALNSLEEGAADNQLFAEWIANFLRE
jgi:GMP synthase-like glutamine amidotransferase